MKDKLLPDKPARVISYNRFSSQQQGVKTKGKGGGDSEDRQIERARAYCEKHDYILDEELVDRSFSGWSEENLTEEASLGKFLTAMKEGKIPKDSILIIESVSRITRADFFTAIEIFGKIVRAGISIVVLRGLGHERVINAKSIKNREDQSLIWMLVAAIQQANQHSEDLSNYVKIAYSRKFVQARDKGVPMTSQIPCWLNLNDKDEFETIGWKVKTIHRVISLYLSGMSCNSIVHLFNKEELPNIIRKYKRKNRVKGNWWTSGIAHLLRNRALIGEHEVKQRIGGKLVSHDERKMLYKYFPPIVTKDQFALVQAQMDKNKKKKGRGSAFNNIFRGVLKDGYGHMTNNTQSAIHIINKTTNGEAKTGKKIYRYYRAEKSYRKVQGFIIQNTYRVDLLEQDFSPVVWGLDMRKITKGESANLEKDECAVRVALIQDEIREINKQREYIDNRISSQIKNGKDPSRSMEEKQDKLDEQLDNREKVLDIVQKELEELSTIGAKFTEEGAKALKELYEKGIDDPEQRTRLNDEILDMVESLTLYGKGWKWTKTTWDMALTWIQPEFLAKYQDVFNKLPDFNKLGGFTKQLQNKDRGRRETKHRFFAVKWKIGWHEVYLPSGRDHKAGLVKYNIVPTDSVKAGVSSMSGSDTRQPWEFNPRAIGFELEHLYQFTNDKGEPVKMFSKKGMALEKRWGKLYNSQWKRDKDGNAIGNRISKTPYTDKLMILRDEYYTQSDKYDWDNPKVRYDTYLEMLSSPNVTTLLPKEQKDFDKLSKKYKKKEK